MLRLKPVGTAATLDVAHNYKLHCVLLYDSILNVRDGGDEVLE